MVDFKVGNPVPKKNTDTSQILGEPNYIPNVGNILTLGGGGVVTLEFTKVRLVDVEGPDLYIFEVGPAVEPTKLEISKDGTTWIEVGKISGGKAAVDIRKVAKPGDTFRFIRLTDLRSAIEGDTPGADIDAVAAIGCVLAN